MADTFIFRKEWIDNIEMLDEDTQDQILGDLARYGAGIPLKHQNNPIVAAFVESQKKRIDLSAAAYEEKLVMSKNAGRKATVDKSRIYELAMSGMSAKEVATYLGCSQSTVQHSDEWKKARLDKKDVKDPEPERKIESKKLTVFDF